MNDNEKIQKRFTEAEQAFTKVKLKFRKLAVRSPEYDKIRRDYDEAYEQFQEIKNETNGETILFAETFYHIKCKHCGHENGAYYDKPPKTFICPYCSKISEIKYEISRRPSD
ncbi:MAG: hypothetical protein KAI71_05010 [Candidatus Pacebacteria bacterium]|nr:hypothetical protein [Candidatus Paceibacterota bacterium]